jgi:DNA-binding NarL/FixJ family response regulator
VFVLGDERKRIILIDDHMLLRQGLERLLNASNEFVICEETGSAAEGLALVREMRPDGAVVDIGLPDADGIELTKQLLAEFPGLVVLVLSMHEGKEFARRALDAGAMGYVMKNEAIDGLIIALRNAFHGKRHFSADVLE